MTYFECETMTGVRTQEEADTLMIHPAVEGANNGMNVHMFTRHGCAAFGSTKNTTYWRSLRQSWAQAKYDATTLSGVSRVRIRGGGFQNSQI